MGWEKVPFGFIETFCSWCDSREAAFFFLNRKGLSF